MGMPGHYEMGEDGSCIRILTDSKPFSVDQLKTCPDCRGPLRNVARYGRIVRRALLDASTRKFIVWANQAYVPLADAVDNELEKLSM